MTMYQESTTFTQSTWDIMELNTYNLDHNTSGAIELNTTTFNSSTWGPKKLTPVVFLGLCVAVGLPSNIAVIIAIFHKIAGKNMSFTLKLMLNLAVCDTLSLLTIPVWIYVLLWGWSLGEPMCKLFSYLVNWSLYASVLTVTSMSLHHHSIMKNKSTNRQLTERLQRRHKCIWLIALWTLAGVLSLPIIPTRSVIPKNSGLRCQMSGTDWEKVSVLLYEVLFGFAIPASVLLTSYLCLHKKVPKANLTSKRRMTRLVVSIVVVFFVFWTPTRIINIIDIVTTLTKISHPQTYKEMKNVRRIAGDFAKTLSYMNCCLDPFLYAFASRSFLTRQRRRSNGEHLQFSSQQPTQELSKASNPKTSESQV